MDGLVDDGWVGGWQEGGGMDGWGGGMDGVSTECTNQRPVSWRRPCDERELQNRGKGPRFIPNDEYSYHARHLAVQAATGLT